MNFRPLKNIFISCAASFCLQSIAVAALIDPNLAAIDALKANPGTLGAVMLTRGNGAIFCTLGTKVDGIMFADNDRNAVLFSPEFRTWHGRGDVAQYAEIRSEIKDLLFSMQNGRCNVAVESAANVLALTDELKRLGMIYAIYPEPYGTEQLADLYANSLGFSNNADLVLAMDMMANSEELQAYFKLGITTKADYNDALARMRAQAYSQAPSDVMAFLKDEAEGAQRHIPAAEVRDERKASTPVRKKNK